MWPLSLRIVYHQKEAIRSSRIRNSSIEPSSLPTHNTKLSKLTKLTDWLADQFGFVLSLRVMYAREKRLMSQQNLPLLVVVFKRNYNEQGRLIKLDGEPSLFLSSSLSSSLASEQARRMKQKGQTKANLTGSREGERSLWLVACNCA